MQHCYSLIKTCTVSESHISFNQTNPRDDSKVSQERASTPRVKWGKIDKHKPKKNVKAQQELLLLECYDASRFNPEISEVFYECKKQTKYKSINKKYRDSNHKLVVLNCNTLDAAGVDTFQNVINTGKTAAWDSKTTKQQKKKKRLKPVKSPEVPESKHEEHANVQGDVNPEVCTAIPRADAAVVEHSKTTGCVNR